MNLLKNLINRFKTAAENKRIQDLKRTREYIKQELDNIDRDIRIAKIQAKQRSKVHDHARF